jgi:hypothetical protein
MAKIDTDGFLTRAPFAIMGVFILILGVLAFPGLSAFSNISGSSAGQGVEVVSGFIVTNVGYDARPSEKDPNADVVEVSFDISREEPQASFVVDYRNAGVFVQLRSDEVRSEWAKCLVDEGSATCILEGFSRIDVKELSALSVIAFDSEADNLPFIATGGDEVYEMSVGKINYRVHEFRTVGTSTFNVTSTPLVARVEYFVVGGGGSGGGGYAGGGGGAGGVTQGSTIVSNTAYEVIVGKGGDPTGGNGNNGDSSIAFGSTALGGGGGGARDNWSGMDGASGGGGGWKLGGGDGIATGGQGTAGQGNNGGNGASFGGNSMGGGGGGFGSAGYNYISNTQGGDGGEGIVTYITGTARSFAGGGGGGVEPWFALAGVGKAGGGTGTGGGTGASAGADNSGSGGGGASGGFFNVAGAGGSGIVILRYRLN